jgi:predicted nucleic acid-binding protein
MPLVLVDTNVLLVLIVGRADRSYLAAHKRTRDYDPADADVLEALVGAYDGIVTLPHVLSEASNLLRQIGNPARNRIQEELRTFILACTERPTASVLGCLHEDYLALGLTDAVVLTTCAISGVEDDRIELLTADAPIYNRALSLGLPAELYF